MSVVVRRWSGLSGKKVKNGLLSPHAGELNAQLVLKWQERHHRLHSHESHNSWASKTIKWKNTELERAGMCRRKGETTYGKQCGSVEKAHAFECCMETDYWKNERHQNSKGECVAFRWWGPPEGWGLCGRYFWLSGQQYGALFLLQLLLILQSGRLMKANTSYMWMTNFSSCKRLTTEATNSPALLRNSCSERCVECWTRGTVLNSE